MIEVFVLYSVHVIKAPIFEEMKMVPGTNC